MSRKRHTKHAPSRAATVRGAGWLHNQHGEVCSSRKIAFETAEAAQAAARASRTGSGTEIYWYPCTECGKYHHTSHPGGTSSALPPNRMRTVSMEKIERMTKMLLDADDLAIDALFAWPAGNADETLAALRLACEDARTLKHALDLEGIVGPARGSPLAQFAEAYERADLKRLALTRLLESEERFGT